MAGSRGTWLFGIGTALLALAGCAAIARREPPVTGFVFGTITAQGRSLPYSVYVPRDYDAGRVWPLILFLHGSGESGADGVRPMILGIGSAIQWDVARWPAIVLFPQKPNEDAEWEQYEAQVMALVDRARSLYAIDPARIYLTGLSQGGHGTWVLGARHASLWAALVPICGYAAAHRNDIGLPQPYTGEARDLATLVAPLPIWAFHGEVDDVVPVEETRALVAAVRAAGGQPKITTLPGVGHGAWDPAYRDPELAKWLFAQRRPAPAAGASRTAAR
jgi:predicted peptidase